MASIRDLAREHDLSGTGRRLAPAIGTFPLNAGDEGTLGKERLMSYATGVVGEFPAYNSLLRSWRDGEPDNDNTLARKAERFAAGSCQADLFEISR